ncbi:phage holin family protein [Achromobacter insuavis]|uniref:phage holin family protein n=1 Tax=Achromobacter insuavis TaxID=1287735 RepID=UPI001F13A357|nr:phage holin family protein [Achromobacter insuavis]
MTDLHPTPTLSLIAVACALLYAATASRFLWYQPNGARHRRLLSCLASALIAALFCRAVEILLLHSPAGLSELVIAALLCVGAWRARGNLATFTRGNSDV